MSRGPHTNWWSEYDDIFLRDNWDKMSASKIGLALGDRSKNSVIGRAHRLGLTPKVEPMPMRPANPAPPPLRRQPLPPATPRVAEKETAVWDNHSCCWPIGDPGTRDFKFCDDPVVYGQSYCSKHRKIAYVPKQRERVW